MNLRENYGMKLRILLTTRNVFSLFYCQEAI